MAAEPPILYRSAQPKMEPSQREREREAVPLTFAPSPTPAGPSLYPLSPMPTSFLGSILIHGGVSGSLSVLGTNQMLIN